MLTSSFAEALKKRGTEEEFSYSELAGGSITLPVDTTFRFIPGFELSEGDFWVTFAIHDPLFRWASGDELSPCLVEKYELLNSNKSLIIKLREDIFWYDGTPITSADIEYSIKAWKSSESSPLYEALNDPRFGWFSIADSKTVVFNFNDSYPEFLNSLRTGIL
ncbi:MAG: ABC transporter substrate-binding protein, partial [Bacteroidales bacterium]